MQELGEGDYARAGAIDTLAWNLFWRYFLLAAVIVFLSNILVSSIVTFVVSLFSGKGLVFWLTVPLDISVTSVAQFVVGLVLSALLFRALFGSQIGKSVGGVKLSLTRSQPLTESLVPQVPSASSRTKE